MVRRAFIRTSDVTTMFEPMVKEIPQKPESYGFLISTELPFDQLLWPPGMR